MICPPVSGLDRAVTRSLPRAIRYGERTGITPRILSCGLSLAPIELDNDALADWHDFSTAERAQLKAITRLSGVRVRRYVNAGTTNTELAVPAVEQALKAAGIEAADLGMLLFCSTGQDQAIPHNNVFLQERIGAVNAFSFDVKNICASFATGLHVAAQFIEAHPELGPVLVVSSEVNSPFLNHGHTQLYNLAVLGDGAAAMVLCATDNVGQEGFIAGIHRTDPSGKDLIRITGGGSRVLEKARDKAELVDYSFWTDPAGLYDKALETFVPILPEVMAATGWEGYDDLKWIVPHQAASLPMAFTHAVQEGAIERGDRVLLACAGAGAVSSAISLVY